MTHPSIAPVRDEWLARHAEAPLEPDLPIVDAHHDCMGYPGFQYYEAELLTEPDIAEPLVLDIGTGSGAMPRASMTA